MTNILAKKSIGELAPLIKQKEISPVDIVDSIFANINKKNDLLNAYIDIYETEARQHAQQLELEIIDGKYRGPLHGIPIGIKDNLYVKSKVTTMGSKIHKNFRATFDATVVKKLKEQGIILTGKLNLDEYAYGVTTENPHYGTSRNPWNTDKITGGSSGGSVSAVSSHMATASIGSETGGSLRAPGSFCGLVSIKPTFGRVSKYGCYPLAPSLDHVGPIAKTVYDAALLLQYMSGFDEKDSDSSKVKIDDYLKALQDDIKGTVIGINEEYFFNDIQPEIKIGVKRTVDKLVELGAKVECINFKTINEARESYAITLAAEASSIHHDHLEKYADQFGESIKKELDYGRTILAVDYLNAQHIRRQVMDEFHNTFKKVDIIIAPTVPFIAPAIGQHTVSLNDREVMFAEHVSRLIRPTTLIGIPAMTVPCGILEGLPFGIQILGAPFKEATILKVAHQIENLNLINKE